MTENLLSTHSFKFVNYFYLHCKKGHDIKLRHFFKTFADRKFNFYNSTKHYSSIEIIGITYRGCKKLIEAFAINYYASN